MSPIFSTGQRVILKANRKEGWPEEHGFFQEMSGKSTAIVIVEPLNLEDDGIREVALRRITPFYHHPSDQQRRAMHATRMFKMGARLFRLDTPDGRVFSVITIDSETQTALGRKAKCKTIMQVPLSSLFPNV